MHRSTVKLSSYIWRIGLSGPQHMRCAAGSVYARVFVGQQEACAMDAKLHSCQKLRALTTKNLINDLHPANWQHSQHTLGDAACIQSARTREMRYFCSRHMLPSRPGGGSASGDASPELRQTSSLSLSSSLGRLAVPGSAPLCSAPVTSSGEMLTGEDLHVHNQDMRVWACAWACIFVRM